MIQALLLPVLATLPTLASAQDVQPPPGMVLIPGGRTTIGTSVKDAERMIREDESKIRILTRETPEHSMKIDSFFLGVTEVTNEQYAAYVRAANARPSEYWAAKVIDDASREFLEAQGKAIMEAKQNGEDVPERKKFERSSWWRKNWEGKDWAVPEGDEEKPVVYVDYQDARAYARWAGVRLMTEFEFQRAVRGDTAQAYPWGEEFDGSKAITDARRLNSPVVISECAEGANSYGVRHLAGNVWEWTSSPFTAYPDFKSLKIKVGKGKQTRTLDGIVDWNANERVAVSGSFQNGAVACRATTRRKTERMQSTDSLGFRVAASTTPGLDIAEIVLKDDVPVSSRPDEVEYDISKAQAMDLWRTADSSAAVENYGVIAGYDYVMFVPTTNVKAVSYKGLSELSEELGLVQLGVLTTTKSIVEPELAAGTYLVCFRAKGDAPEAPAVSSGMARQDDDGEEVVEVLRVPDDYNWGSDNLIYYHPEGEPVAWAPAPPIEYTRPKKPEIKIVDTVRQIQVGVDEDGEPILEDDPITKASFVTNTWAKVSNKAFHFTLPLTFERGAVTNEWRH